MAQEAEKDARCTDCGNLLTECSNPETDWYPVRIVDYAEMARLAADRAYDDLYEGQFHDGTFKVWTRERTAHTPFGHRDGVRIVVSPNDLTPDEDFLNPRAEVDSGDQA